MEEVHRVTEPGGRFVVKAPHWKRRREVFADPTHARVIFPSTWDRLDPAKEPCYVPAKLGWKLRDWYVSDRGATWGPRMGSSNLQLGEHLAERLPWLGALIEFRPTEATYELEPVDLSGSR